MNLNKVFVLGRLTSDPQLRTTPGGQSVGSFSIATNRVWTDKSGARQEEVEYHNIVVWGKQAEIANQFLKKGSLAFVEGRLQTRSWQDKQGQARKTTEIVCDRLQLGPRPGGGGDFTPRSSSGKGKQENPPAAEEIPTIELESDVKGVGPEDLPF